MTPSITAWPPTRVSSPLSRTGRSCKCALKRKNSRIDKFGDSGFHYSAEAAEFIVDDRRLLAQARCLQPILPLPRGDDIGAQACVRYRVSQNAVREAPGSNHPPVVDEPGRESNVPERAVLGRE